MPSAAPRATASSGLMRLLGGRSKSFCTAEPRTVFEIDASMKAVSPVTGAELPHKIVVPNQALKSIIRDWEEQEHKRCMAIVQATQEGELQRRKRRKTAK